MRSARSVWSLAPTRCDEYRRGRCCARRNLQGVRGRLERCGTLPNGASIYVDYAHKPDALAAMLTALRPHTQWQADSRRLRLRRRPGSRQAAADGRDRGAACRPRDRDRRQSAQRRRGNDPRRGAGGSAQRHRDRRPRRGHRRRDRNARAPAILSSSPARDTSKARSSATIFVPFDDASVVRARLRRGSPHERAMDRP